MANYLLLRNNKESGPYSLDDLIELGLKPYDLVWVQGRSAAWRYPSEVEELKPIAPAVEEQPFDRFFKKTEEKNDVPLAVEQPRKEEAPAIKPEYEKYIPKKSVCVTMPGQKNSPAREPIKETLPSTTVQPTISISENPAAAQIKYSQPLDEIKEMYVKTLHERKQKIARKSFWLQNLKKIAAVLALVAVGLIAGYFIKSNKNNGQKGLALESNAAQTQPLRTVPPVTEPDTTRAATSTNDAATNETPSEQKVQITHPPTSGFVNKDPQVDDPVEFKQKINKPDNSSKQAPDKSFENKPGNSLGLVPSQGSELNQATGERSRKMRTENEISNTGVADKSVEKKPSLPQDIAGLVSVKSNDYKKVAFGGIRDLQLTVTNDSKYILENVTVELQYIRPNELPLKTENIQFTSIGPNATSTIRVPDTNRGIKVVFRIVTIKRRPGDERVADN